MNPYSASFTWGLAVLSSLAFACGGGTSGTTVSPPDDAGSSLPAPAPDSTSSPDPSSTPPSPSSPDASSSTPNDTRIDPIEVGRAWTYNVTVAGTYSLCQSGLSTATTIGNGTKDGKPYFRVQSFCDAAGTYDYAVENDRVHYYFNGGWRLATDEPVQAGHEWSDGLYDNVWEHVGTETVAAGTFTDCWKAKRNTPGQDYFITFCRGVGPVRWHYSDGFGSGYDAVLVSKNF